MSDIDETKYPNFTLDYSNQQASDQYPSGYIIAQSPDADSTAKVGTTIKLTVSTGPETNTMKKSAAEIRTVSEAESALPALEQLEQVKSASVRQRDLGTGIVSCQVVLPEGLFYEVLSGETGFPLASDAALLRLLRELAGVRREYDRVAGALEQVKATGYGVVLPTAEQMKLEPPQIVRKNGSCAVRLHASAPSIHLMLTRNGFTMRPESRKTRRNTAR